ncbi:hypothetical protein [Psychrobacillus antarcticus]|uniref:hypothetical protein n=1 Tax=Psychrobacillus antarcticus TaxID=2879115 RepID=UPI0024082592|nr:hypothetical protein [Psychrobacillus antarcticus]
MKIFVATILLLISFYIIKVDLIEGTIPLAYSSQPVECEKNLDYITVEVMAGDTLQSLFSLYPTDKVITYTERLTDFYNLNPHFINQTFKVGEKVFLPTYSASIECK